MKYIKYGQNLEVEVNRGSNQGIRKLPKLETVKNRKPKWYSVPKNPTSDFFIAQFSDKNLIVIWNEADAQCTDNFTFVKAKNKNDAKIIFGYLISSIGALCGELHARSYGGGVLKMQTFEAKEMPRPTLRGCFRRASVRKESSTVNGS